VRRPKRSTVGLDKAIWNTYPSPDGRLYYVPYTVQGSPYRQWERRRLKQAMLSIERRTCIRFWQVNPRSGKFFTLPHTAKTIPLRSHAVIVNSRDGRCGTGIGRHRPGRNPVYLAGTVTVPGTVGLARKTRTCTVQRILLHELLHLLGLYHEHQRPDRDEHVIIHYNRVKRTHRHNYDTERSIEMHGLPYDYRSESWLCSWLV